LAGLVTARDAEVGTLAEELAGNVVEKERLARELENRCEHVARLSAAALSREDEINRLSNELSVRNSTTRRITSQLTAREREIARLKDELCVRQEAFCELSLALGAQACEMRRRSEEMVSQAASLKEAAALGASRERELTALRNSLTWRMTEPVRQCIGWLSGLRGHERRSV
jgi:chromosome segregation ATPase